MLYVPLDCENNLTVDDLTDSKAYVSAIAQNESHTKKKQKTPSNFFKNDDPPSFQIHVANGQLEKPLASTTPNFKVGENTC